MSRLPDWIARLDVFLALSDSRPFEWGANDCALFACSAIDAMTGRDPGEHFRARYKTARGAKERLRQFCGKASLERTAEMICEEEGFEEVAPAFAQRGDLVAIDQPPFDAALGVVDLNGRECVFAGPHGATRLPLAGARRAWRIA
ncbi:MAG: hypothetical protein RX318_03900 [bacterium]|nr:hypothetical protein [bacterium]